MKYINKNLNLKKQIGGECENFDNFFYSFITICKQYNENNENIVHINGGASIKYHLSKRKINHTGITNDIDILLIGINQKSNNVLENFISFVNSIDHKFTHTIINGINQLVYNDCFIDITIYNENDTLTNDRFINDISSMFGYALQKTGFINIYDYIKYIKTLNDLDKKTFTSPLFEFYSTEKGIENMENFLNINVERHKKIVDRLESKINEGYELNPEDRNIYRKYKNQITFEYIDSKRDKLERYKNKHGNLKYLLYDTNKL